MKIRSVKITNLALRKILVRVARENHYVVVNPDCDIIAEGFPALEIEASLVTFVDAPGIDGASVEEICARLSQPAAEKIDGCGKLGSLTLLYHSNGGLSWTGGSATRQQLLDFLADYSLRYPLPEGSV